MSRTLAPELIAKLKCFAARGGHEAVVRFDPGMVLIAIAGGALVWWFMAATTRRHLRSHPKTAFAGMWLFALLALLPLALLVEGVLDGSLRLASRGARPVFFECTPGRFWLYAGLYYFMFVALTSHAVTSWSHWKRPPAGPERRR